MLTKHSVVLVPFEDMMNFRIRLDAGSKEYGWRWVDVTTGATMLKDVKYSVEVVIKEYI